MRFANIASVRNIGVGLLALLATVPLIYAQRSQQPQRGVPARAPEEHRPVVVDRVNHGTIRHVDTHIVQRPIVEVHHNVNAHQQVFIHHDVEVDIDHARFWNGFVFGRRVDALRAGCLRVLLNGAPYYYDDGIYYQQAGDGYQEVYPPVGVDVPGLPNGATEIVAGNLVYYYAGGAFYVQQDGGFVIAVPPMGVIVPELPPGAVQVSVNGNAAYQFGIYYQPVFVNGVTQYMTFMP
jgi:hypothetical protein